MKSLLDFFPFLGLEEEIQSFKELFGFLFKNRINLFPNKKEILPNRKSPLSFLEPYIGKRIELKLINPSEIYTDELRYLAGIDSVYLGNPSHYYKFNFGGLNNVEYINFFSEDNQKVSLYKNPQFC